MKLLLIVELLPKEIFVFLLIHDAKGLQSAVCVDFVIPNLLVSQLDLQHGFFIFHFNDEGLPVLVFCNHKVTDYLADQVLFVDLVEYSDPALIPVSAMPVKNPLVILIREVDHLLIGFVIHVVSPSKR